jgi:hypothetical protein
MELHQFTVSKRAEIEAAFASWLKEIDWKPGQSLIVKGKMEEGSSEVNFEITERGKKAETIFRTLTPEELAAVAKVDFTRSRQKALINVFLGSGNKPLKRREVPGNSSHVTQVNKVLRNAGLSIGIRTLDPGRCSNPWDQRLCLCPVSRT